MGTRGRLRTAAAAVTGASALVLLAGPAAAHDPIFVDDDTPAADSPRIVDGSISFATYGVIDEPGGSAHLRLDHADGDELVVELLVPDQPPEGELDDFSHLTVEITDPEGEARTLRADEVLGTFDEPFTRTSYLRLLELAEPAAAAGTYAIAVTSEIPTRFTLATGRTEQFGTPVEGYERQPLAALDTWYSTPPPTAAPTTTVRGDDDLAPSAPTDDDSAGEQAAPAEGEDGDDGAGPVLLGALALVVVAIAVGALVVRRRTSGGAGA